MSEPDELEFTIELNYIETPHGRVPKLETIEKLGYAVQKLSEQIISITSNLSNMRVIGGDKRMEEIEERLNKIEKTLEDIVDRQAVILDALQELAKTVAEIKRKEKE